MPHRCISKDSNRRTLIVRQKGSLLMAVSTLISPEVWPSTLCRFVASATVNESEAESVVPKIGSNTCRRNSFWKINKEAAGRTGSYNCLLKWRYKNCKRPSGGPVMKGTARVFRFDRSTRPGLVLSKMSILLIG